MGYIATNENGNTYWFYTRPIRTEEEVITNISPLGIVETKPSGVWIEDPKKRLELYEDYNLLLPLHGTIMKKSNKLTWENDPLEY